MGDWLYMSAFETSLVERSLPILDILTAVTRKMTEGELLQLTTLGRGDLTEELYFDILLRKTAYLFSACCEIGALLGGASVEQRRALADYGLNLGAAFQLVDDLLDFTADEDALGKAAGVDLIEGKLTLPLIYLLEKDSSRRAEVQTIMREGNYTVVPRARLVAAAEQTGALDEARARAYELAESARAALDALPPSEYRDALAALPTFIIERDR
jgi:octaprenyl-diphosphate synthase